MKEKVNKMPGKRKDKDEQNKLNKQEIQQQTDHETFLQAFEKPTQIYRYLRTRNMISPIFLNRNLSYMRLNTVKTKTKRSIFKINDMLDKKINYIKKQNDIKCLGNFMSIMFMGFYDKNRDCNDIKDYVQIETILLRISHKKRKENLSEFSAESIGVSHVCINPNDDDANDFCVISIPADVFKSADGMTSQTNILLFKAYTRNNFEDYDEYQPNKKQVKTYSKLYNSEELVIFDKAGRCLLIDGEYVLCLEQSEINCKPTTKYIKWETIPENVIEGIQNYCNPFESFDQYPTIKFRLVWTDKKISDYNDFPAQSFSNKTNETNTNNYEKEQNNNKILKSTKITKSEKYEIIYQFIYNSNSIQQTESISELFCPWCSLNCIKLYSLLKHLKLCHDRFKFIYKPNNNNRNLILINVMLNNMYDGSYNGSPYDYVSQSGYAYSRIGPIRRTVVTHLLVFRPRRQKPSLIEFAVDEDSEQNNRPFLIGHDRLYHHTMTYLPVHPKELDIDSEAENDPHWLQHKTVMMIDEFTDVNDGEKEIMKMWNLHIMKYVFVGDCQIEIACDMFLDKKGRELLEKKLYRNFLLHLCSLFDYGLLAPESYYKIVQKLQKILGEFPEAKQGMAESRKQQMDHWLKIGIHKPPQPMPEYLNAYCKRNRNSSA